MARLRSAGTRASAHITGSRFCASRIRPRLATGQNSLSTFVAKRIGTSSCASQFRHGYNNSFSGGFIIHRFWGAATHTRVGRNDFRRTQLHNYAVVAYRHASHCHFTICHIFQSCWRWLARHFRSTLTQLMPLQQLVLSATQLGFLISKTY